MSSVAASNPPIRAFLSYSRQDDQDFSMVGAFVGKLTALVKAKSGRDLDVFVDQVAIEWGADWRQRLTDGVQEALIFLPLLSANYVSSQNCRDEFFAFYSKANVLGVTELLLPVLLFEAPMFSVKSDDDLVRLAAARQWEVITDGILAGGDSPEFLQVMNRLSDNLLKALEKAEAIIAEGLDPEDPSKASPTDEDEDEGDDEAGEGDLASGDDDPNDDDGGPPLLSELMVNLQEGVEEMTSAAESLGPAIEALGAGVDKAGPLKENPTPRDSQAWAMRVAHEFREPARVLESKGQELFVAVRKVDESIGGLWALAEMAGEDLGGSITDGLREAISEFGDMAEVEGQLAGLLEVMRPGELISVPLRKSLRPARRGLTKVTDSLQIIRGWSKRLD